MNGKINKNGFLCIERAGKMESMDCLCRADNGKRMFYCSDTCPAFGEPVGVLSAAYPGPGAETGDTKLQLCSMVGSRIFTEFKDERVTTNRKQDD